MATIKWGNICLLLVFLLGFKVKAQNIDVKELININKPFEQSLFPKVSHAIHNFAVIDPGLSVVPIAGGIYIAGWKKWFLAPSAKSIVHAIDYLPNDTSVYLIAEKEGKKMLLQLNGAATNNTPVLLAYLPGGSYNIRCVNKNLMYIMGRQDKLWKVWKYNGKELQLFFESEIAINDMATTTTAVVMAIGHTVVYYGPKVSREVIKLDLKIDGIAIAADGTLFVSTEKGILHYLSPEYISDADIVTSYIHGKLRVFKNTLYVLWREQNQVLELGL
ncbi:hypothetical protein [Pedobacter sp. ASV12]|uniref:hypothetical protein n=1 Tax=Pedobacter sp. ASV12 TaxID=2795120 RepID=UPI0018EE238D|nr:hypothetical protein [Pedobacter sp. ASV12]